MTRALGAAAGALFLAFVAPRDLPAPLGRWAGNGPPGGTVQALAVDPSDPARIYAGTANGGIFRSADRGATWTNSLRGEQGVSIGSIAPDTGSPGRVFAGTSRYATGADAFTVLRSLDSGASWVELARFESGLAGKVAVSPGDPTVVLASIASATLQRSEDAGETWSDTGVATTGLLAVDLHDPSVVYTSVASGRDCSFLRSADAGKTWTATSLYVPPYQCIETVSFAPSDAAVVYAEGPFGLFRSGDSGETWEPMGPGPDFHVTTLAVDPEDSSHLYAGSSAGAFISTDGGANWVKRNGGLNGRPVNTLAVDPEVGTRLYAGTDGFGVSKSEDGAAHWFPANDGLNASRVFALAVDPADPERLYASGESGYLVTDDAGSSWRAIDAPVSHFGVIAVDPGDPSILLASGKNGPAVVRSADRGETWEPVLTAQQGGQSSIVFDPHDPQVAYAAGSRLWKSLDSGQTWTDVTPPTNKLIVRVLVDPFDSRTVYALGFPSASDTVVQFFRSSDAGATWSRLPDVPAVSTPAFQDAFGMTLDPHHEGVLYMCPQTSGILRSVDGGVSFAPIGSVDHFVYAIAVDPVRVGVLYAGTFDGLVLHSVDDGETWSELGTGFPRVWVAALILDPRGKSVWVGTNGVGVRELALPRDTRNLPPR